MKNEPAAGTAQGRTGLDPWTTAELPAPPQPQGLGWLSVVGPGVIVLGIAIGSGEFLLGPAVFVKHGLTLLWVTAVAIFFQTVFNTEVMRYVVATGEPVVTGFMRTPPSSTMWAWVYALFYFLQAGWPAWAATAAGAVFFLFAGRLAGPGDVDTVYFIGIGTFLVCIGLLLVGRRIERTLEILNWILVSGVLGSFLILAVLVVPGRTWGATALGFFGFDMTLQRFVFLPEGVDFFLLGALAAFAGAGGIANLTLANWARDKGYGMSKHAGYIPAAVAGKRVNLTHHGFVFAPNAESLRHWRGWWRIVRADQWGVFFTGSLLGMALPALLYVTFLPHGTEIRGLGISAALAQGVGTQLAPFVGALIGILGAWLLFKTQLDTVDAITRSVTDILWTGSRRLRSWRGGDVRAVYYSVLALVVLWGVIALRLAQPIMLLQIGANVAGVVLTVASIHLLYINCRLLAPALRPPLWRRVVLVCMSIFYGCFAGLSLWSLSSGVAHAEKVATLGRIERLDPAFDRLVARDAAIELLAANRFQWAEGPVWDAAGRRVLFSDIPRNTIWEWSQMSGLKEFLKPSGYTGAAAFTGREPGSNGLAFNKAGELVLCQHGDRRIAKWVDGKFVTLADRYAGKRLNSPNDLAIRANGDVYFTDPPYGLPRHTDDPGRELDFQGVYRLSAKGELTLLTRELNRPNGLAFSPDEKTLYVANSEPEKAILMAFPVKPDGSLGSGSIFFDVTAAAGKKPGLPDGLKVSKDGTVWATGPGGVLVYSPQGKHLGTLATGVATANLAFGDDGSTLYLTADKSLARVRTQVKGW